MLKALSRILMVVVCSWGAISLYAADKAPAPLKATFEGSVLVVANAGPGARVVFFGITRTMVGPMKGTPRVVKRAEVIADDDADGMVRLDLQELALIGLWGVVDLSSGAHLVVPVPGFDPRPLDAIDLVKHDNAGQLRKVDWYSGELDLLVVRPGEGAWRLEAAKFSQIDETRNPHAAMRVDVESLRPIDDSPAAPKHFKNGDVLVLIDAWRMAHTVIEVGK